MANPFPFVSGSVLLAAELNGIGEAAVSFTPTYTGYTRGNGTVFAEFMRVNKLVFVFVQEILGSTSSVSGAIVMTLPVAGASSTAIQRTGVEFFDNSGPVLFGQTRGDSSTAVEIAASSSSGSFVARAVTSATVPFTWTTGDRFSIAICYQAA